MPITTKEKLQEQAIQAIKEYVQQKGYNNENNIIDEVFALLGQDRRFVDKIADYEYYLTNMLYAIADPEISKALEENLGTSMQKKIISMFLKMINFFRCLNHEPTLIHLETYGIENYAIYNDDQLTKTLKEYKVKLAGLEAERKMAATLEADSK